MTHNSDYTKKNLDLYDLVPEVYQSDINKTLFRNVLNRYLTKPETKDIAGYIGKGNPGALFKRQILEDNLHQQAFQLQPTLYTKVGSVEYISTWKDILNELERLGVDPEMFSTWGQVKSFNWVPPINIDKLTNYRDYYWVDVDTPNSKPQYITVRNRCSAAEAAVKQLQRTIDKYGSSFPIQIITESVNSTVSFNIDTVNSFTITVEGNATTSIRGLDLIDVESVTVQVVSTPIFDDQANTTSFDVSEEVNVGSTYVKTRRFDKISISGDFTNLFEEGFVFFVEGSTNVNLRSSFVEVASSSYDDTTNMTTIRIKTFTTDNTADGIITLDEQLGIYISSRDCLCYGATGWDEGLWDDNPATPLWAGEHSAMMTAITHNSSPVAPPQVGEWELWYNSISDTLYQFNSELGTWGVVWNNFSTILAKTTGTITWDSSTGCSPAVLSNINQWIDLNKWVHKTDVDNFSIARAAQYPIIEFDWNLEINEWTEVIYSWSYRKDNLQSTWYQGAIQPNVFELLPISLWEFGTIANEIVLDERYGDMTSIFSEGYTFKADTVGDIFVVVDSYYERDSELEPFRTHIVVEDVYSLQEADIQNQIESTTPLVPHVTSQGDVWKGYDIHWCFNGVSTTRPINHQVQNIYTTPQDVTYVGAVYDYKVNFNVQEYMMHENATQLLFSTMLINGTKRNLVSRALVGHTDIRVYINGIRQCGTYEELTDEGKFVKGVSFLPGCVFPLAGDIVRIEVGESSMLDLGRGVVPVRMTTSDSQFEIDGTIDVSLIRFRKTEQIKTSVNQYPIFDLYNVDSNTANIANNIFGYAISPEYPIIRDLGIRMVRDVTTNVYTFESKLVNESETEIFAYRDYSKDILLYWFNESTQKLMFWNTNTWSEKKIVGNLFTSAFIGAEQPTQYNNIDGFFWFDNELFKLYSRNVGTSTWDEIPVTVSRSDPTLQTVWRTGPSGTYTPAKVDWNGRTLDEYNNEMQSFLDNRISSLIQTTDLVTATTTATDEWYTSQQNKLSTSGAWVGDWEIPDPLYYNAQGENRRLLTSTDIVSHFSSIISNQVKIPGFVGSVESMFHLIPTSDVDFGRGGTIKTFNGSFDNLLSAIYIDNVTPPALINFAHRQYDSFINGVLEVFVNDVTSMMCSPTTASLEDLNTFISTKIQEAINENDNLSFIYGDTTTYGGGDTIRNCIATLPYLQLVDKHSPSLLLDEVRGIKEVVHHDGHRVSYNISRANEENIIRRIVSEQDIRTPYDSTLNSHIDTFGRISVDLPPNTITEFATVFNTTIQDRMGVYWYYINSTSNVRELYRLNIISIGTVEPSSILKDGSLWLDTTPFFEVLRIKKTNSQGLPVWEIIDGLNAGDKRLHNGTDINDVTTSTISAWQKIEVSDIVSSVVFDIEQDLYNNVPSTSSLRYDYTELNSIPGFDERFYGLFLEYTANKSIVAPLVNVQYDAQDAFSWNYTYSTPTLLPKIGSVYGGSGVWQNVYNNLYSTPYPHLEPWILQGYTEKPTWWDTEYLNDDIHKWGNRRWKYSHGFKIVDVDRSNEVFSFSGSFSDVIRIGDSFGVDSSTIHGGLYTIKQFNAIKKATNGSNGTATIRIPTNATWYTKGRKFAAYSPTDVFLGVFTVFDRAYDSPTNTTTVYVEETITNASSFGTNSNRGSIGCRYDPVTNNTSVKVNENITSNVVEGRITIAYGMWENIRNGVIPEGKKLPNVDVIPTYNYFSVNIKNEDVVIGSIIYGSDDIFPPYAITSQTEVFDINVRTVFNNIDQILYPSVDYIFGDVGPNEWLWRSSSDYLYGLLKVAFELDPVHTFAAMFGRELSTIDDLVVDVEKNNTPNHTRLNLHGEIIGNEVHKVNGANQWYVNYNRYTNNDSSFSNFRTLWSQWEPKLSYLFSGFVDSSSIEMSHRSIDITKDDYSITSKHSLGVDDAWIDAFNVTLTNVPPKVIRYDNQHDWRMSVNTCLPISQTISYYDVHNYPFMYDPLSGNMMAYTWEIFNSDTVQSTITIKGDQTTHFIAGQQITLSNTSFNNGSRVVVSVNYNSINKTTIIEIANGISEDVTGGYIATNFRSIPWETGTGVYISSTSILPSPLSAEMLDVMMLYFIINIDGTQFKFARTKNESLQGSSIAITSNGVGTHYVGSVVGTFTVNGTSSIWKHYEIDKSVVKTIRTPFDVQGMQHLVNIVDGYDSYLRDAGWSINNDSSMVDPDTGRIVTWQLETERFISTAYKQRQYHYVNEDRYRISANSVDDTFTFTEQNSQHITGDAVKIISDASNYPLPLLKDSVYYIIRDTLTTFRLATSRTNAIRGISVDITTDGASLYLASYIRTTQQRTLFTQEINPLRNSVWFSPSKGIVSNVIYGPWVDSRSEQLVYDQYGRILPSNKVRVVREDHVTSIVVSDNITNDVEYQTVASPYKYLHLGGAHLFIDTYEHIMLFNNNTTEGVMIYDPFIGLNVTKFNLLFRRSIENTGRPNVGGYFISIDSTTNGILMNRNIEATIDDVRNLYDIYSMRENDVRTKHVRNMLGYEGSSDYFDGINVNSKSQFLFWQGMIQHKGSKNAIDAFINSRRFIDAKVDEYWAIKIADFGSINQKSYPEMIVLPSDPQPNELRYQFISPLETTDNTFISVLNTDESRWINYPDQSGVDIKFETTSDRMMELISNSVVTTNDLVVLHNYRSDDIRVTATIQTPGIIFNTTSLVSGDVTISIPEYVYNVDAFDIYVNGIKLSNTEFSEVEVVGEIFATDVTVLNVPLNASISVVYKTVILLEGTHYERINSFIVQLSSKFVTHNVYSIKMWAQDIDYKALTPLKLIDRVDNVTITSIQYWNPAKGVYDINIKQNIDIFNDVDPATYTDNLRTEVDNGLTILSSWGENQVGTTWLDTSSYDFVPYFDEKLFKDHTTQSKIWGSITEWSNPSLYEWVKSDYHPSQYDVIATVEEGDKSIDEQLRKSGTALKRVYEYVNSQWVVSSNSIETHHPLINGTLMGSPLQYFFDTLFVPGSSIQVYVNGIKNQEVVVPVSQSIGVTCADYDVVTFVQLKIDVDNTTPIDTTYSSTSTRYMTTGIEGLTFTVPYEVADTVVSITVDGIVVMGSIDVLTSDVTLEQPVLASNIIDITFNQKVKVGYEFTTIVEYDNIGIERTYYYFWVRNKSTKPLNKNRTISCRDLMHYINTTSIPFVRFARSSTSTHFNQMIVYGIKGWIDLGNILVIQMTRDFTLRDEIERDGSLLSTKHVEWELIREGQPYHIKRSLWNKVTEAIIGEKLNTSVFERVPSFDRVLYDETHGTDTQHGIGTGQAITKGQMAIDTILADLTDPNNDFYPTDIDAFLQTYSFDTKESSIEIMDKIYTSLAYTHVNRIMFAILRDAFSLKREFSDIMKTSMISLNGIKPLQDLGIFDD